MNALVSHYSGCGNDFILLDDRRELFPENDSVLIKAICIQAGVDGLILVRSSLIAAYRMRFFNNDGYETSMCGNGIRCMMRFIVDKIDPACISCLIETLKGPLQLTIVGSKVQVEMGNVQELGWNIELEYTETNTKRIMHHLDTGVPHLVTFVDDLDSIDIQGEGSYFRHLKNANVNFVDVKNRRVRTFERGVEGETLACGTGVTAVAYALHKIAGIPSPISLKVRSQEVLDIAIMDNTAIMTGPAKWIRDLEYAL
ncbi:MAG: dapF [Chlamydiia bacterium]|nr:dapF [Chlamydiia bacterium]